MKLRILFLALVTVASSSTLYSQIKITPEEVTYERTGENLSDWKKKFTVSYPRFSGVDNDDDKRFEQTFSYWHAFDVSLEEERNEQGLDALHFAVKYNDNGLLALELNREGSGASVSSESRMVVSDRFGNRIRFTDAFKDRIGLLSAIDKKQAAEMVLAEAKFKKEGGQGELFATDVIKASDQVEEFFVDDYGVTFLFEYGFPRVNMAAEPAGEYFFSWKEIKPYLREYTAIADLAAKAPAVESIVPILDLRIGGVLGGTVNGKFVSALAASKSIAGQKPFVVFDPASAARGIPIDKYQANWLANLAPEQPDDICPDFRYVETNPAIKMGIAIGHSGKWNPVPHQITEIPNTNQVYRGVVASFLSSKGLGNSKVSIDQIYKVDLEGDGADEIVIRATNYTYSENELNADIGGYSFVLVRKIVNGATKEIMLTGDFIDRDHPGASNKHEISAIADLNGDGIMEVVVYGEYYEGAWVAAYNVVNGEAKAVLETGCGV